MSCIALKALKGIPSTTLKSPCTRIHRRFEENARAARRKLKVRLATHVVVNW